uniref:Melanocortin-2 receptor accessory protein n=1 Tax=Cyanoderma ruficeps TaxID=181631 RepID=A0A8C3QTS9_9PASS
MANRTNSSEYFWSYEYYWDYIDPIPVDGSKLEVNKYSIVIAFWVGLAAFVMFLFLILLCMSCSGSTPGLWRTVYPNKPQRLRRSNNTTHMETDMRLQDNRVLCTWKSQSVWKT